MRCPALPVAVLLLVLPRPLQSQEPPLSSLAVYRPLLQDALRSSPDLLRLQALNSAERARIPQAGALPDPELSLGMQRRAAMDVVVPNPAMPDMPLMGFTPSGTEYSLMAMQTLPWPGKRQVRADLAQAGVSRTEAELVRTRMDLEAQLQEGLGNLLRLRAELGLLADQDRLWAEAEVLARQCCELGTGTQADLLQAMMARARLAQRRLELEAQEDLQRQALNRIAGRPLEVPLEMTERLEDLPRPVTPDPAAAAEDARRRSPEWALAGQDLQAAQRAVSLGRMELRPDFRITAGAMKEPGMGTGWKAEIAVALPLQPGRRMNLAQRNAEQAATQASQDGLARTLSQSVTERLRAWDITLRQLKLFEEALLPQGELALGSLLGQYQAGKVAFQGVLDALNARLKDRQGRLDALARLQSLAVAQQRVALGATAWTGTDGPGGMGGGSRPAAASSSAPAAPAAGAPSSSPSTPMSM